VWMRRQQYDGRGWRATFYTTGMEHSPVSERVSVGTDAVACSPEDGDRSFTFGRLRVDSEQ